MSSRTYLGEVADSLDRYHDFVNAQVARARTDTAFGQEMLGRWAAANARVTTTTTPTGLTLPRTALPFLDEPGAIARYFFEEGLPGEFPFLNAAYAEMYLAPEPAPTNRHGNGNGHTPPLTTGSGGHASTDPAKPTNRLEDEPAAIPSGGGVGGGTAEEPTRLFAGLGLAEDTNERFHYLSRHQRSKRLSTAFDGPTLYGTGAGADGVFGKIGEGGTSVDTVDDMERLYDGFQLDQPTVSVSMTINGPAPIILAMYVAAAKRRFGADVAPKLRGTIQADVLKEVQAQNEMIFPVDASLRFLADMVEYTTKHMPKWYPYQHQRLPHRRGRGYARATGRLHPQQRLRLRRPLPPARPGRKRLRPPPLLLLGLRPRRRIPRPREGLS